MSRSAARSSNSLIFKGSMRKRRDRSSSWVFSARHTSTTIFIPSTFMPTSAPAHSSGYASLAWSCMWPTSPAPILSGKGLVLPETFGEVLVRPITQHGHDDAALDLARHPKRGRHGGAGRDADQDALLAREALDHLVGVLGRGREVLVGDGRVVDLRHHRRSHVLHALETVERRVGLEGDDLYPRVVLLEARGRPDEGAASPQTRDEVCHLAAGLFPDLRPRRLVVRPRVGRVGVLVRVEVPLGVFGDELPGFPDRTIRTLARVREHDIDAVRIEDLLPLLAGVLRHAQLHLVA